MVSTLLAKVSLTRSDLCTQLVEEPETCQQCARPRFRQLERFQQLTPRDAEESETGQGCPKLINVA